MLDFDTCYRAMACRDARFDGAFFVAVMTTGVYCRPVCGSRTPKPANVRFFRLGAAAAGAGFRACRRCRPELSPSASEWNIRGDLVARALRLIAGGAVDEVGVAGVARQLAVSERHLHRQLMGEVGIGPLGLALNRRTQIARMLIEAGDLSLSEVAFAAGYSSIRQFNDGMRAAFGCSPKELRGAAAGGRASASPGPAGRSSPLRLRLRYRPPLHAAALLRWLGDRVIPAVEAIDPDAGRYRRTLRLPRGPGSVELDLAAAVRDPGTREAVTLRLWLADLRDVTAAVRRCRDLLDLDADPAAVADVLGADPALGPLAGSTPGLRVPGGGESFEAAVRVVVGQEVPLPQARMLCDALVRAYGEPVGAPAGCGAAAYLFPDAETLVEADLHRAGLPASTATAVQALAREVAGGRLRLERDADRAEATIRLRQLPGLRPWAVHRIAMHALGDPDAFEHTDPSLRPSLTALRLGAADEASRRALSWRPWRSYAAMHLQIGDGRTPGASAAVAFHCGEPSAALSENADEGSNRRPGPAASGLAESACVR